VLHNTLPVRPPANPLEEDAILTPMHRKTKRLLWGVFAYFEYENKTGVVRIVVIFQDSCSAISFKRSRRELFMDVAEHRSILKNKGVKRVLVIFQDRTILSHVNH